MIENTILQMQTTHPLSYERAPAVMVVVASRPLKLGSFFLVLAVHPYGEISAANHEAPCAIWTNHVAGKEPPRRHSEMGDM